jgi:hypothetical protein
VTFVQSFENMKNLFITIIFGTLLSVEYASAIVDADGDGMSDVWEKIYNFPSVDDGSEPANLKAQEILTAMAFLTF